MSEIAEEEKKVDPQDIATAEVTDTIITKCPNCGGNMIYDPEKKGLKCEYCGYVVEIDFSKFSHEIDLTKLFTSNENEWGEETHVFKCNNCGATEILSKNEISKKCSFCGTTNVVETDGVSGLKPNAILPFTLTKENACEKVVVWAKKKIMAPRAFKQSLEPGEMFGNFYPAFTFDSDTFSNYDGELGEYYYVTKKVNGKTVQERRIKYFRIHGSYVMKFDDVIVQALADSDVKAKFVNELNPYDTNHSQEYQPNFLQGYSATQYSKDGKECWDDAKKVMDQIIRKKILSKYHYDVVRYLNVHSQYANSTYKYVMLPVYIGHFEYSQKNYNYFINGQTGKVSGKTPVSAVKVAILVGAIVVFIALAIILFFVISGD